MILVQYDKYLCFKTFIISDPVNGLIGSTDVTSKIWLTYKKKLLSSVSTFLGGALGDCTNDQFSITSPGNMGSPIICGFNTGQHSKMFRRLNIFSVFKASIKLSHYLFRKFRQALDLLIIRFCESKSDFK